MLTYIPQSRTCGWPLALQRLAMHGTVSAKLPFGRADEIRLLPQSGAVMPSSTRSAASPSYPFFQKSVCRETERLPGGCP
jgi:hypothetical protein